MPVNINHHQGGVDQINHFNKCNSAVQLNTIIYV